MGIFRQRKRGGGRIVVLVDYENIIQNTPADPSTESPTKKIIHLMEEIRGMGRVIGVFVFVPRYLAPPYEMFFWEQEFFPILCPKIRIAGEETDTSDETLIKFGKEVVFQFRDLTHLCLLSGDADFLPLLKLCRNRGLEIMVAASTIQSLAKDLIKVASVNPDTKKRRISILYPNPTQS